MAIVLQGVKHTGHIPITEQHIPVTEQHVPLDAGDIRRAEQESIQHLLHTLNHGVRGRQRRWARGRPGARAGAARCAWPSRPVRSRSRSEQLFWRDSAYWGWPHLQEAGLSRAGEHVCSCK